MDIIKKYQRFRTMSVTKKILVVLPYALACCVSVRFFEYGRLCSWNLMKMFKHLDYIAKYMPNLKATDVLVGIPLGIVLVYYLKWEQSLNKKNTRPGEEHGSARWGTHEDIQPFIDKDQFNNLILSSTERISMEGRMSRFELNRNKNVLFTGGSGTGKTFTSVKPNLMQCHSSYVVTDPKGTVLMQMGSLFEKEKYNIYVLDTVDMSNSMHYNPFAYIRTPKDILTLANAIYQNMKPQTNSSADPFFDNAALLWLQCMIGYLWYEAPEEEQNIPVLLKFLEADDVREEDESYKNAVDLIFEELEQEKPNHFAVKQRKKYKQAAGKTAKSILITLGAYLSPFDIPEVSEIIQYDELKLDTYGDPNQKSILFVIISDTDKTYNFLTAIMFTQIFNLLCYKADKEYGGELPTRVQCVLDEFRNIGKIPDWHILISTMRSRGISAMMYLQTKSQLKSAYGDDAETIVGNCDSEVFLGGKEKTTIKDLEENLGEETLDLWTESHSYSTNQTQGVNYSKIGRKLKTAAEIMQMDRNKCIVQVSGLPPFLSDKYNATNHPNYKWTDEAKGKSFIFAEYRKREEVRRKKKEIKEKKNKINHIKFNKTDKYVIIG